MKDGALAVDHVSNRFTTGRVDAIHAFPDGKELVAASRGLFLAHVVNGAVKLDPIDKAETGDISWMHDFPDDSVLLLATKGLFVAHRVNGEVVIERAWKSSVIQPRIWDLPGAGRLIDVGDGAIAIVRTPPQAFGLRTSVTRGGITKAESGTTPTRRDVRYQCPKQPSNPIGDCRSSLIRYSIPSAIRRPPEIRVRTRLNRLLRVSYDENCRSSVRRGAVYGCGSHARNSFPQRPTPGARIS
jgi:hypothetical protein